MSDLEREQERNARLLADLAPSCTTLAETERTLATIFDDPEARAAALDAARRRAAGALAESWTARELAHVAGPYGVSLPAARVIWRQPAGEPRLALLTLALAIDSIIKGPLRHLLVTAPPASNHSIN